MRTDARYQLVDEERMVEALVWQCWPHQAPLGDGPALRASALRTLERWAQLGLGYRMEGGRRQFDPCEVLNFMKTVGASKGDLVWPSGVAAARRNARLFNRGRETRGDGVHSPARFSLELRREFNLERATPGSMARLRIPMPFEDRAQRIIGARVVEPAHGAQIDYAPGRLEVKTTVPADRSSVVVHAIVQVTSFCETIKVDPNKLVAVDRSEPEAQLYSRTADGFIRVTPRVAALAATLAGNRENPWDVLNAIWAFFFQRLKLGYIHPDALCPDDPLGSLLDGEWFDCFAGSSLLVAMCRAQGIPARVVGGFCLDPDVPTVHYWAEVFLPPYGWFPVDLASWDFAAGEIGDTEWSHYYFGNLDYRMKTECLPRSFVGPVGVKRPPAWYLLVTRREELTEIAYYGIPDGLLYRDAILVTELSSDE